jgi:hypothetical protein
VTPPLAWEELTIFANGDRMWRGQIGEDSKDLCLKIYHNSARGLWPLRLGIWAPPRPDLHEALLKLDDRAPAIGFERLVIVPEGDLQTRLEILQNLIMSR